MDVNYRRDYDQIKQQYKGTLTLEGKKITKQLLKVEISTKEKNITTYDKEAANKETTIVFGTITLLLAIVGVSKDILPKEANLYAFLVITIFIIMLCFLAREGYRILQIERNNKEKERKISIEKEEIKKLELEKLVIGKLAFEEDGEEI